MNKSSLIKGAAPATYLERGAGRVVVGGVYLHRFLEHDAEGLRCAVTLEGRVILGNHLAVV